MQVFRRLMRTPGFTVVALLTIAVGIGANTAIFSVVESILLKPLPWPEPERLVGVWHASAKLKIPKLNMNPALYFTYRDESKVFLNIGLWNNGTVTITQMGQPEEVRALFVTEGTLPTLRVKPILGHSFTTQEDTDGSPGTVMLTWGYWQRRFGGAASAIGTQLVADGKPRQVIGILPRDFHFMDEKPELLLPMRFNRGKVVFGNFSQRGIARLKPGMTIAQANAEVARMMPIGMRNFPPPAGFSIKIFEDAQITPNVMSLQQDLVGDAGDVLWVLMGTVGAVLLIACANVANLLLVRAEGRQHELAVRAALGAGWGRIARDLLMESLALGAMGGVLGLGVAWVSLRVLVAVGPHSLPRLSEIGLDPAALGFTFGVSLLCGLLFGVLPVFRFAGVSMGTGLRESGRSVSHSKGRIRARNVLVVVQVALALVLLIGSALTIRTFRALRSVEPGFTHPEEVMTLRISIPEGAVKDEERVARMEQEILTKIAGIPGVRSAGLTSSITMDGNDSNDVLYAEDHPVEDGKIPPIRRYKSISPGYFGTMGNPVVAGRDLTWTDVFGYRKMAIVSEDLAREYWGTANAALGKRIREGSKDDWSEIIGVAGNEHDDGVQKPAAKIVYWPMLTRQLGGSDVRIERNGALVIRSSRTGATSFLTDIQKAVWAVSSGSPLADVRTLDEIYRRSMARTSFTLVMLAIAGGMALVLGLVGIYGVIAYSVAQRRREIGIRMALGAQRGSVSGMFVRHGLWLALTGILTGLGAAAALTQKMESLLFGVKPIDLPTYASVALALTAAVLLASYIPARRASAVDPIETLRAE